MPRTGYGENHLRGFPSSSGDGWGQIKMGSSNHRFPEDADGKKRGPTGSEDFAIFVGTSGGPNHEPPGLDEAAPPYRLEPPHQHRDDTQGWVQDIIGFNGSPLRRDHRGPV